MKTKKLAGLFLASFVTIVATDFVIHRVLLKGVYLATQHLWRPESEMGGFMPFMIGGQALTALFFAWIFLHGYKGTGVREGIRYGLLMTGISAGMNFMMYAVQPYPLSLVLAWIALGGVQAMATGAVCAKVADR